MTDTLVHRGPDDSGVWEDAAAGIAIGQRRLAIVDLSPLGHQPMVSASGRYQIVFNGEIYNWRPIRAELQGLGHGFRSESDTEVLLAACEQWGLEGALQRCVGMFAIALWDTRTRTLALARDRLGEKPLFVLATPRLLAFASEVRAFAPVHEGLPRIDSASVGELLRFGYIASNASIYEQLVKVPPGHIVEIACDGGATRPSTAGGTLENVRTTAFWRPENALAATHGAQSPTSVDEAVATLERILKAGIADQMLADVPVGAFLSGGVDSSTVVAIAQSVSRTPVRTFSLGFEEPGYDEAPYAKAIAAHLGTAHSETYVSANDALGVVNRLGQIFDEPFADPSQIPAFMVAEVARREVTVCLSGDGGDEVFGGYNRYFSESGLVRAATGLPRPVRSVAAAGLNWLSGHLSPHGNGSGVDRLARMALGAGDGPIQDLRGRFAKAATLLGIPTACDRYWSLISAWQRPEEAIPRGALRPALRAALADLLARYNPAIAFMLWDLTHYLPGDNLNKVDRTSMAVSLEVRAPLLDHRVVEFALPMLRELGVRRGGGPTKWPLRMLMDRYIPEQLTRRPKMGFSVPLRDWLRGDLRSWADRLLGADALRASDVFSVQNVQACWQAHVRGEADRARQLWPILMFQQWYFARHAAPAQPAVVNA